MPKLKNCGFAAGSFHVVKGWCCQTHSQHATDKVEDYYNLSDFNFIQKYGIEKEKIIEEIKQLRILIQKEYRIFSGETLRVILP